MSDVERIGVRMANQGAAANANLPIGTGNELTKGFRDYRQFLAEEAGSEPACPFCQTPRVRRSDYVRCNDCGVNWLDSEMHLPNCLNRNPAAARMVIATKQSAVTSGAAAD